MKTHLTERFAKSVQPQGPRDLLFFDDEVAGFGLCVDASGARAFVLSYRVAGRKRRLTIGSSPDWSVTAAREEAKRLKREVDAGHDPLGRRIDARKAPTMRDLIGRYLSEHAVHLSERNRSDQASMLRKLVEPDWARARSPTSCPRMSIASSPRSH